MIYAAFIAFLIGLQANLHCVSMCGPLALAAPIDRHSTKKALWSSLSYNLGRISTYTYLGFLLGLFGISSLFVNSIQVISIFSGMLMMVSAIFGSIETWGPFSAISALIGRFNVYFFPKIKELPSRFRPFLFGLLNGLLPCGMVYLALVYSLSRPQLAESVLLMFTFGIGTLPTLLFIPLIGQKRFFQVVPRNTQKILLFVLGFMLLLRGLGLGIPYVSPQIKQEQAHKQPSIECCEVQK